ncbi:trp operon leader peptide [Salmonella enterica]|nr:trp operon leader peptide [Salmonella enterica]
MAATCALHGWWRTS